MIKLYIKEDCELEYSTSCGLGEGARGVCVIKWLGGVAGGVGGWWGAMRESLGGDAAVESRH